MSSFPIIYLNGVSSAGKTTLAKCLQREIEQPFLRVGIDAFIDMLPAEILDDETAYRRYFPVLERGFHFSVNALVLQSNNVIVDHVLGPSGLGGALEILEGIDVLFVGVHCPIDELERREKERGDRKIGQARSQLEFVHHSAMYDLELDTSELSPEECVVTVVDYIRQSVGSRAFERMRQERSVTK